MTFLNHFFKKKHIIGMNKQIVSRQKYYTKVGIIFEPSEQQVLQEGCGYFSEIYPKNSVAVSVFIAELGIIPYDKMEELTFDYFGSGEFQIGHMQLIIKAVKQRNSSLLKPLQTLAKNKQRRDNLDRIFINIPEIMIDNRPYVLLGLSYLVMQYPTEKEQIREVLTALGKSETVNVQSSPFYEIVKSILAITPETAFKSLFQLKNVKGDRKEAIDAAGNLLLNA
jgi:hypothetical protein